MIMIVMIQGEVLLRLFLVQLRQKEIQTKRHRRHHHRRRNSIIITIVTETAD